MVCLRLLQDDDEEVRLTAQSMLSTHRNIPSSCLGQGLHGYIQHSLDSVVEEVLTDHLSKLLADLLVASYYTHFGCESDSMCVMVEFDVVWIHLSSIIDPDMHDVKSTAALLDKPDDTPSPSSSKIFEAEADNLYIEQTKSGKVLSQAITIAVHRILDRDEGTDDGELYKKHAVLQWLEDNLSPVMSKVQKSLHQLVNLYTKEKANQSLILTSTLTIANSSLSTASFDTSMLSYQSDIFRQLYLPLHFISLLKRNSITSSDLSAIIGISVATSIVDGETGGIDLPLSSSRGQRLDDLMLPWSLSLSQLLHEESSRICIDQLHPWINELIMQLSVV